MAVGGVGLLVLCGYLTSPHQPEESEQTHDDEQQEDGASLSPSRRRRQQQRQRQSLPKETATGIEEMIRQLIEEAEQMKQKG